MASGKVKWFNIDKGFGFIINDEDGREVFFHTTHVADMREASGSSHHLRPGDLVTFDASPDPQNSARLRASNVRSGYVPAEMIKAAYQILTDASELTFDAVEAALRAALAAK